MSAESGTSVGLPRSIVTQDYLKAIYAAGEWEPQPMGVSALAARMGVSPSTVSETIRRLSSEGLVEHRKYGSISLTDAGLEVALRVIRRHRLIETFLVEQLGYDWHEVHDEAEVLEHAVSDQMVERIDAVLGRPVRDPHGDPIPGTDGSQPPTPGRALSDLEEGRIAVVVRIDDTEPQVLQFLADLDIGLDSVLRVGERRSFAGTVVVALRTEAASEESWRSVEIGEPVASAVWVRPTESADGPPA